MSDISCFDTDLQTSALVVLHISLSIQHAAKQPTPRLMRFWEMMGFMREPFTHASQEKPGLSAGLVMHVRVNVGLIIKPGMRRMGPLASACASASPPRRAAAPTTQRQRSSHRQCRPRPPPGAGASSTQMWGARGGAVALALWVSLSATPHLAHSHVRSSCLVCLEPVWGGHRQDRLRPSRSVHAASHRDVHLQPSKKLQASACC